MEEFLPKHGEFFMRPARKLSTGDGTLVFGFISEELVKQDEIWLIKFIIADVKKFKVPLSLRGMRADQILCSSINMKDLEEIKPPTK